MRIMEKLSLQIGEKTEEGNQNVAKECLQNPSLLEEISQGLLSKDAALMGDCTEVLTKVAKENPNLVKSYAKPLAELLTHKTTRVRWEAMHAISLITELVPYPISELLPLLKEISHSDKSTIVRVNTIDTVCYYANTSESHAEAVFPLLKEGLDLWEGKHRARILKGLLTMHLNIHSKFVV